MSDAIKTAVARADFGENRFMGHSVIADLVGRETLAGDLSRGHKAGGLCA